MPRLADRPEDIPLLFTYILERKTKESGRPGRRPEPREIAALRVYDWPGNVRELEKVVEYFVAFSELPPVLTAASPEHDWRGRLSETLARNGGNKAATARELGISRKTLHGELAKRGSDLAAEPAQGAA